MVGKSSQKSPILLGTSSQTGLFYYLILFRGKEKNSPIDDIERSPVNTVVNFISSDPHSSIKLPLIPTQNETPTLIYMITVQNSKV